MLIILELKIGFNLMAGVLDLVLLFDIWKMRKMIWYKLIS